ncbi:MAG TPA: hypothetical protein VNP72_05200 [Longimicrobium sp.]|nr:hypothetical protein [Longimicrobium sp.]
MKFAMGAAALITLPAMVALVYGLLKGPYWLPYAAAASLALNTLPFIAFGLLMKKSGGHADLEH